jgi:V/A-type H+-transporting ATPase subunit I
VPIAKLLKATLILPRNESAQAVSSLAELEWFHPLPKGSEHVNPELDNLLLRAQKLFQSIDEVVRALTIPLETGVMATMFKGAPQSKTQFVVEDLEELVADLESKSKTIVEEARALLNEHAATKRSLEENQTLRDAIKVASGINLDLAATNNLKRFHANMFIVNVKDLEEIERTLEDLAMIKLSLNELKSALVIFGGKEDSERIAKVLRSFDTHPFLIPSHLPQNPSEAYKTLEQKVQELEKKLKDLDESIEKIKLNISTKILSLHEGARVAKDVLETMRKPGGTKNFAVIQGFIPSEMEKKIRQLSKEWVCIVEEVMEREQEYHSEGLPSLLTNTKYLRTFEVITATQGIPRYGETDPTPMIAFVWPLFYGLMFGDLGHGLLLFGLGMLLRTRGLGGIRTWGTLIAASGAAAAMAGLITGEFFGWHIAEVAVLGEIFHPLEGKVIGILQVSELTFDQVIMVLKVSIAIGIIHLVSAFVLNIRRNIKEGRKLEVYTHNIPILVMYFAVVALILAAIGSGYDIIGMFGVTERVHNEPVPWITFLVGKWATVDVVAKASVPVLFACIAIMMLGHIKEEKHRKAHGIESEGGGMMGAVIEIIMVRTMELLSHTISYSRLGIMLLVHVALLITVNDAYTYSVAKGDMGAAIGLLIGGNIGIIMIEGLIVYIQAIRLHLYEWFPKWYVGEGVEFKKIVPQMLYTSLLWEKKKK